ncbi:dipeptide epimerase [Metabacillus arenae]|uniref:Dipeptide epimerase n=1 Tax=Metabacillus arenae TaxID=2771434 RepID=A0A926NGC5_9BACI|nr:dipeptide epimerase [Metabacillus arenae]MBD1380295.1 dipeptide epimerase [Metabacillus arenae]
MRIQSCEIKTITIPLVKPFKTALRTVTEIENTFVYLKVENGVTGIGSAAPTLAITGDSKESIEGVLKHLLIPEVTGKDLRNLNDLSVNIQNSCIGNTSAKAAMEIALYDAFCKSINVPLYQFLGGKFRELKNDKTVSVGSIAEMTNEAKQIVQEGISTIKVKVGKDWTTDGKSVLAIREAVGNKVTIRLDANQGWTVKQAIHIITDLEKAEANIELVEQPIKAADIYGLKQIKDHVTTPIMADESLFSPSDALRLLNENAVDYLNIKLMKTGGIRTALQIADIAEAAGIECMIGSMMESAVSVTAAIHLAMAHPNITKVDMDAPLWLQEEIEGIQFKGESIILGDLPGLGIHTRHFNSSCLKK